MNKKSLKNSKRKTKVGNLPISMEKDWFCSKCRTSNYHNGNCPKCGEPFKKRVVHYNMAYVLLFTHNIKQKITEIYGVYANRQAAIDDGELYILPNIKNYTIEDWDLDTNQLIQRQITTKER